MKKIALILLIIVIPILASTKPTMPGEKVSLIHGILRIGKGAEIKKKLVNAKSQEEMDQYTNEYHEWIRGTKRINLNEKIPLYLTVIYGSFKYDNAPFCASDSIEIKLSLEEGGYLADDNMTFKVNEPDDKHMRYYKNVFTYLIFEEPGIYKLHYTAQIKTNDPELEKYYYSFSHDQFFAFTEYGNIYAPSIESLNKKLEELKEMARRDKELKEAEERYKEKKKEKDKEKKVMDKIDVPHIFKHIIEFEEEDDVVKDTLKKHNIEYEFEDGKFIFRKSQELRLNETNLKYKVVESIYEETTEEEQLRYDEKLEFKKNSLNKSDKTPIQQELKIKKKEKEKSKRSSIRGKELTAPEFIQLRYIMV